MATLSKPRVVYSKSRGKWLFRQQVDGKIKQLGTFDTEDDAWSSILVTLSEHSIGETTVDPKGEAEAMPKPSTFPKETKTVLVCSIASEVLLDSDLSDTAKQQGLYLLSLLPNDGKARSLHSKILGRLLSYQSKICKVLIPDFVTRGHSYSSGSFSKQWGYTKKPSEMTWHEITNENLLDKLTNWKADKQKNDLAAQGQCAGTDWMIQSLYRVSAGLVAEELLARKELLMPEVKYTITPESGRIWHSYTQLPSGVRLNLLLDGQDVAEIDMAKSQVAILSKFWTKSDEERGKLQSLILDGTIYSRLEFAFEQDRANIQKWNGKNPKEKITTTKQLFNKAVMGFQKSDWHSFKQLEREFPVMMKSIAAYKWKSGADGSSRFANKLQAEEALIMAKVAEKCQQLDIPCVPIFDGMLVPISQAETVKGFFTETLLERLGFAPEPTVETAGDEVYADLCVNL